MKNKKLLLTGLIIGNLTIASQLMGCAAASQSELLQMINNGEQIEIEIATPKTEEQGEESTILWEELAYITTNPDLRSEWDSILGITGAGDSKNGIFYVDAEGNHDLNNTLKTVIHNQEFTKLLADENTTLALANASLNQYADLDPEDTTKSLYMGINGYFNLLPDNTPNYSNPDSTLTRAEFLTMVMRSETPVTDITPDDTFTAAVGESEYNKYAQELANDNYLDTASKSLNNMTYNGTITRAEAIYLLMNHYFPDELTAVEVSKADLTDAKDGGNIAEQQKFIESGTPKDYWKSYELTYALQNPDQGLPTDLYKALVLANSKGLIAEETRWDEGLTKSEAIGFLIETLKQDTSINGFSYKQGIVSGLEATDTVSEETTKAPEQITFIEDWESIESKTVYATVDTLKYCNWGFEEQGIWSYGTHEDYESERIAKDTAIEVDAIGEYNGEQYYRIANTVSEEAPATLRMVKFNDVEDRTPSTPDKKEEAPTPTADNTSTTNTNSTPTYVDDGDYSDDPWNDPKWTDPNTLPVVQPKSDAEMSGGAGLRAE